MANLADSNLFTTLVIIVIIIIFVFIIYKFYLKDKKEDNVILKGIQNITYLTQSIIFNPYQKGADPRCVWSDSSNIMGLSTVSNYMKTIMCQHDGDFAKYTMCFWLRINNMSSTLTKPTVKHIIHIGDLVNMDKHTGDTSCCQPGVWLDTWTNRLIIRFYTLGREKKMLRMIQVNQIDFNGQLYPGDTNPLCYDGDKLSCQPPKTNCLTNTCFNKYGRVIPLNPKSNVELNCSNLCHNNENCTMSQVINKDSQTPGCQLYTKSGIDECTDQTGFNQALFNGCNNKQNPLCEVYKCGKKSHNNFIHKKINTMSIQAIESESDGKAYQHSKNIVGTINDNVNRSNTCKYMNSWPTPPYNGYLTSIRYHNSNDYTNGWWDSFKQKGNETLYTWTQHSDNYLSMNPYFNHRILTCEDEGIDIENVPLRRWFHVAITTQPGGGAIGGLSEVYINGKLVKSKVYNKSEPPIYSNPSSLSNKSINPQGGNFQVAADSKKNAVGSQSLLDIKKSNLIEYYGRRNLFIGLNTISDAESEFKKGVGTGYGYANPGITSTFNGQIADIYYFCNIKTPAELAELYKKGPVMSGWNRFLNKLKNMKGWISIGIQIGDGPMHSATGRWGQSSSDNAVNGKQTKKYYGQA